MAEQERNSVALARSPRDLTPEWTERFSEPICLTAAETEPALFAVGRTKNDFLVESRYRSGLIVGPLPLVSFAAHAPDLLEEAAAHPLVQSRLATSVAH